MTNHEKSIDFLDMLGTEVNFFYSIDMNRAGIKLRGELSSETRRIAENYVTLDLASNDWLEGSEEVDGLKVKFVLTF